MRKDIILDNEMDFGIKYGPTPKFLEAVLEGEEDQHLVYRVDLSALPDDMILSESLFPISLPAQGEEYNVPDNPPVNIEAFITLPFSLSSKSTVLYFKYLNTETGEEVSSEKYKMVDYQKLELTPQNFKNVDEVGYHVKYDKTIPVIFGAFSVGAFIVKTYKQGDFIIDNSIPQNEKMLLISSKGGMLENPTTGIDIIKNLNGIIDIDAIKNQINKELNNDELRSSYIAIDSITGSIILESKELYKDR